MKLTFFGAARAVTGSCHCVECGGKKSLFAVILCTFTRVPETGSQTKKNPRGLHFRRGSSRERRFELEI